jgi:hypothetical protein
MGEQQRRMVEGAPAEPPKDRRLEGSLTDADKIPGAASEDRSFETDAIDNGEEREAGDSGEAWLSEGEAGSRRGGEDALTTDAAAPHQDQT